MMPLITMRKSRVLQIKLPQQSNSSKLSLFKEAVGKSQSNQNTKHQSPWPSHDYQPGGRMMQHSSHDKKTYVVYYQGLLLRQIEAELFFYKNLHNVKVPSTVCISKLWKKDIHNGMCIRSHIRKSLSYEDDFFLFLHLFA